MMLTLTTPQEVVPGLTIESVIDQKIVCITANSSSRQMVDAFVDMMNDLQTQYEGDEPRYFLIDFSQNNAGFNTPYGRSRMADLTKNSPDAPAISAIVVHKTYVMTMAQFFLNQIQRSGTITRLFFHRDDAIDFLRQSISKHTQAA